MQPENPSCTGDKRALLGSVADPALTGAGEVIDLKETQLEGNVTRGWRTRRVTTRRRDRVAP